MVFSRELTGSAAEYRTNKRQRARWRYFGFEAAVGEKECDNVAVFWQRKLPRFDKPKSLLQAHQSCFGSFWAIGFQRPFELFVLDTKTYLTVA